MFLVSTSIKPSTIHGLGCFADEKIKKGQKIWVFDERIDIRVSEAEFSTLPAPAKTFLAMYSYAEMYEGQKVFVISSDHSKHMNHSDRPNVIQGDGYFDIAARDIEPGEELTCNYHTFDLDAKRKLS
jgi:hypothetical protein